MVGLVDWLGWLDGERERGGRGETERERGGEERDTHTQRDTHTDRERMSAVEMVLGVEQLLDISRTCNTTLLQSTLLPLFLLFLPWPCMRDVAT